MTRDDRHGIGRRTPPPLPNLLRRLCGAFACLALAGTARAEEAIPPLGSFERVPWLVELIGPMPRLLWGSLVAIGALLLVCIIYCAKAGGRHER